MAIKTDLPAGENAAGNSKLQQTLRISTGKGPRDVCPVGKEGTLDNRKLPRKIPELSAELLILGTTVCYQKKTGYCK